jgi:hypothetical protein
MTEATKKRLRSDCLPGKHVGRLDYNGRDCSKCSTGHVEEFGHCIGFVEGPLDYNNCKPGSGGYDPAKVGPEVDVRWEPSHLRFGYAPNELELVAPRADEVDQRDWAERHIYTPQDHEALTRYFDMLATLDNVVRARVVAAFEAASDEGWRPKHAVKRALTKISAP